MALMVVGSKDGQDSVIYATVTLNGLTHIFTKIKASSSVDYLFTIRALVVRENQLVVLRAVEIVPLIQALHVLESPGNHIIYLKH